jgi:hypothetical protein
MSSQTSKHSTLNLNPSGAHTWLACRAQPGFLVEHADELPEEVVAPWTEDGIKAHDLGANLLMGLPVNLEDYPPEMLTNVNGYVAFVRENVEGGMLSVEKKVPLWYMPSRNGKVDAAIVNHGGIYIVDYKNGVGVSVEARNNPQLAIYGNSFRLWLESTGLCDEPFADQTLVTLVIYQPQARDGRVTRLWCTSVGELKTFCAPIEETAKSIQADPANQPFAPSDDVCRFCPAAKVPGLCKARSGSLMEQLPAEVEEVVKPLLFPDVGKLTPTQLGKIVRAQSQIEAFLEQVRAQAFVLASAGTQVPGCKLVAGISRRAWKDEAEAERLLRQKFTIDQCMPRTLVSVPQSEKLFKGMDLSTKYKNLISAVVEKPAGKPTLVSADDPRDELNPVSELRNLDGPDPLLE